MITFVDSSVAATPTGNGITSNPFDVVTGGLVVFGVTWLGSGFYVIDTISDDAGNTYHLIDSTTEAGGVVSFATYYSYNSTAKTGNIIFVDFSSDYNQNSTIVCGSYDGLTTTDPLDTFVHTSQNGTSNSLTTPSFTTAQADEVLIGLGLATYDLSSTWSAGSGYTVRETANLLLQDQIVSSIQTSVTMDASDSDGASIATALFAATFKAASAAAGFTPLLSDLWSRIVQGN